MEAPTGIDSNTVSTAFLLEVHTPDGRILPAPPTPEDWMLSIWGTPLAVFPQQSASTDRDANDR